MMSTAETTRDRVLDSASMVFAEKGYRDATVAEICELADANIASVNYYFRDKKSLYDEVWRHAFEQAIQAYPLDIQANADSPPEDRLRSFISAMVSRLFSEGHPGYFAKLQLREMAEPTSALEDMVREAIIPQRKILVDIVQDLLGERADMTAVNLCVLSVVSQCLFLGFSEPVRERLVKAKVYKEEQEDTVVDHIAGFSLAGIQAVRCRLEEND